LADLGELDVTAYTSKGPLLVSSKGSLGNREVSLRLPPGCEAEVVLGSGEQTDLAPAPGPVPGGHARYLLPAGAGTTLRLRFS
jgi:hypothetical protein